MVSDSECLETLLKIINRVHVAMMTTTEPADSLRSRPLATLRTEEFDDFLWFYTAADSHKIAEIRKPHPVNLKLEGLVRTGASDATIATGFVFSDITPSQP